MVLFFLKTMNVARGQDFKTLKKRKHVCYEKQYNDKKV